MNPDVTRPFGGLSPAAFADLFRSVDALRNRRALLAMLAGTVVGVLAAALFSLLAARLGFFMGFLGGIAMFVAGAAGINAAGVLLMDQARGLPLRTLGEAATHGLLCIPKFIGLSLLLLAVALAVFAVLAAVYAICKIPVLGPVMFVLVFPLSVLVAGLALFGLLLCMLLSLPAIWEGEGIIGALAQALAIARRRGIETVLLLGAVGVLAGAVGFVVFGVLFTGLMPSAGLAASILGGDGPLFGMMRHGSELAGEAETGGSSYALAAGIGGALLWALAGSLLSLVYLLGLNLVYLRVTEGLAAHAGEPDFEHTQQSAPPPPTGETEPRAQPRAMPHEATAPAVAKTLTCPQCLSSVGRGDAFCGVCGHRLT